MRLVKRKYSYAGTGPCGLVRELSRLHSVRAVGRLPELRLDPRMLAGERAVSVRSACGGPTVLQPECRIAGKEL